MLSSLTYEHAAPMSAQHLVETTDRIHETAIQTPQHQFEAQTNNLALTGTKAWAQSFAKSNQIDEVE